MLHTRKLNSHGFWEKKPANNTEGSYFDLHTPSRYCDSNAIKTCDECGSHHIVYDKETYEHVCGDCGLIMLTEKNQRAEFVFR